MPKKVLLTGASGLIGSHIVRALLNRGDSVIAITTDAVSAGTKLPAECRIVSWQDYMQLAGDKIDAIINLAGSNIGKKRWTGKVKKEIYNSRILSTRRIVELIKSMAAKPEALINASGADYYGNRGSEIVTEESAPGDDFLANVCIDWEKEAYNAEDYGVRVAIIRNGFVLARDAPSLPRLTLPFRLFVGGKIGTGKQYMSWIHINDIVRIYLLAADNRSISTAVNAASPIPVTMKEFGKNIAEVLHRPFWFPIFPFIVKLVAGQAASLVLHGRRALPAKLTAMGFEYEFDNSLDALKDILP
jgi:uncharacterized protein (TIGR01777 family)